MLQPLRFPKSPWAFQSWQTSPAGHYHGRWSSELSPAPASLLSICRQAVYPSRPVFWTIPVEEGVLLSLKLWQGRTRRFHKLKGSVTWSEVTPLRSSQPQTPSLGTTLPSDQSLTPLAEGARFQGAAEPPASLSFPSLSEGSPWCSVPQRSSLGPASASPRADRRGRMVQQLGSPHRRPEGWNPRTLAAVRPSCPTLPTGHQGLRLEATFPGLTVGEGPGPCQLLREYGASWGSADTSPSSCCPVSAPPSTPAPSSSREPPWHLML